MDRAIVFYTLLLIGMTWLLYKLTVLLEPRSDKSTSGAQHADGGAEVPTPGHRNSSHKLINQRLRK